ncbi:acetate/propionate family kinase [Laribacter hongkongensis]|uniref:acetate/propionate family kinase n=1 Tax=Laribacter hongkongensis TaxID=168471 RepID=UPI001EFD86C3|nr:acetate/propionate family kinase [Laribacter hongkongensis]MCG9065955.1 acetate/propionate family kinase [Laribacter hongkongensis]
MKRIQLVLNAGSATLKFECFSLEHAEPEALVRGLIDGVGKAQASIKLKTPAGETLVQRPLADSSHASALRAVFELARERDWGLEAVVHRVVHGGALFDGPVVLDDAKIARLRELAPLAPLHQPVALAAIEAVSEVAPGVVQIACFDTAFHIPQDPLATRFGLARRWHDAGVRRYGFHGLSYAAIARKLPGVLGAEEAEKRVVVMHLGSGSSACAIHRRQSVASSMGFSAVDGLMMGTRPGNLDPEVILYWIEHEQMSLADIRAEIYKQGGLLGVSGGLSSDMRELIDNPHPHAQEAVALFCYRAAREIGALAVQLGGIDHLVFTAGIGERSARVRARIVERLAWLGLKLDQEANQQDEACISTPDSSRGVWVIRTDEEGEMARQTRHLLQQNPAG